MSSRRTALIVLVPEADLAVGRLRMELDPVARLGVPAHFSVLFPFVPADQISDDLRARVAELFRRASPFTHTLTGTDWFGHDVLWMSSSADEQFSELTRRVWKAFPAHPPYEGVFGVDVVPHLTIAYRAALSDMRAAEQEVKAYLPIEVDSRAVTLMTEQSDGRWRAAASFTLGLHGHPTLAR